METTNISERSQHDDEISLRDLVLLVRAWCHYLLGRWKIIFLGGIIGGVLGFTYAHLKKPVYTAECTFVLEESGGAGGLGQYAGLASIIGIDLGGGGSNGIFRGDNIFELYKSRRMIEKTLLTPSYFDGKEELLIDRFVKFSKLRARWSADPQLANIQFSIPREKFTLQHDSIINGIVNTINKNHLSVEKPDDKLSIVSVRTKAKDELFAKAFTKTIVDNVNKFYIQTKTKITAENVKLLQRQADSVRAVLNASIGSTASAIDANPNANIALQVLRVPSQRRQIDVQANSAIYAEVVKNLEIARISLRKETPLIQVIDEPILPLRATKLGKVMGIVIGGVLAAFLTTIFLITKKLWADIAGD